MRIYEIILKIDKMYLYLYIYGNCSQKNLKIARHLPDDNLSTFYSPLIIALSFFN